MGGLEVSVRVRTVLLEYSYSCGGAGLVGWRMELKVMVDPIHPLRTVDLVFEVESRQAALSAPLGSE